MNRAPSRRKLIGELRFMASMADDACGAYSVADYENLRARVRLARSEIARAVTATTELEALLAECAAALRDARRHIVDAAPAQPPALAFRLELLATRAETRRR